VKEVLYSVDVFRHWLLMLYWFRWTMKDLRIFDNYNMNIPFGMIDYRNMSMDIRMYIEIEQDSFERSKWEVFVQFDFCFFFVLYFVEFFKWFIEINNGDNKRKDFLSKTCHMSNHETAFECNENNNENSRPKTNTTTNCPIISFQRVT